MYVNKYGEGYATFFRILISFRGVGIFVFQFWRTGANKYFDEWGRYMNFSIWKCQLGVGCTAWMENNYPPPLGKNENTPPQCQKNTPPPTPQQFKSHQNENCVNFHFHYQTSRGHTKCHSEKQYNNNRIIGYVKYY